MLRHMTGAETEPAVAALAAAGGNVKTAVLLLHGLDLPAAQTLLARHDGHLRPALQEISR
ncbi:MAG TPA: N-acetylmuramic acid 6-phosphate etherase, partial [Acetobacteraceae bacterium]|nr:N-acetylmuramic acid 6-phosphate etherase [Acetobacteraceae bacterium]